MARHTRGGPPRNRSERWAIDFLQNKLPEDYWLISNIDVTDQQGNRLEVDALVLGRWAIYLVEIKGYTGTVTAGERVWDLGRGYSEETPLNSLGYKARVLASRIRDRITGSMHVPWCQATVFVTGNEGTGLNLAREAGCGSVCDASDIIETLTTEEGLTARHAHEVTREQRELVIQVLGQIGRLSEIDNRLQAFQLVDELYRRGGFSVHLARLADDALERQFLVKQVERAAFQDSDERTRETQRLRDEFRLYMELSNVPGAPYVTPLIDDGERLALPIGQPLGHALTSLDPCSLSLDERIGVLRSTAHVLERIHHRGIVHGALQPQSIFVADDHQIELLDFAAGHVAANDYSSPEVVSGRPPGSAADVYSIGSIFCDWFSRGEEASEPDNRELPRPGCLNEWLDAARRNESGDRPTLAELLDILRMRRDAPEGGARDRASIEPGGDPDGTGTYRLDFALGGEEGVGIWRATHLHGHYPCAIQVATVPETDQEPYLARFRALSSLVHPALSRPLDIRRIPGEDRMLMATQWIEGQPLDQIAEADEVPEVDLSLDWFRQLLTGLQYCHRENVMHRNLTPASIIANDDQATLVEFAMTPDAEPASMPIAYLHPHARGTSWRPEFDLFSLAGSFLWLWTGVAPRNASGQVADLSGYPASGQPGVPDSVWGGLKTVLEPGWSIEADGSYLEIFGLEPPAPKLKELPNVLRQRWQISRGHQERLVCFALRDRTTPDKPRTRTRNQLATLTLRAERISANDRNVASAKAQISNLLKLGLFETRGRQSIALTTVFLEDARRYVA